MSFEQPIGELLLTPRTLDRPFFSELATGAAPASKTPPASRLDDWGRIYAGLFTNDWNRASFSGSSSASFHSQ